MPRRRPRAHEQPPPGSSATDQLEAVRLKAQPSAWVARKRYILDTWTNEPRPWSFRYREWQRAIMDDTSPRVVIMKSAQMGLTEVAMSRAMHWVDAHGRDVLYVFPTEADVSDFSAARFDTMLDMSPELRAVFGDVSNVGLKRAGTTNLYLRGSNSRSGIKSIPVSVLILDEFDEIVHASVSLVRKRLLGAANTWEMNLSTPRYPGVGIDKEYQATDRHRWHVPCPKCGEFQALEFPANVQLPVDLERSTAARWCCSVCDETWTEDERLDMLDRGRWVPENPGARVRGYHISQLYSPVATAAKLCDAWREAGRSEEELEEFYNSHLGLGYEPKGLKVTPGIVEACRGTRPKVEAAPAGAPCVLGVDVGARLHYKVWVPSSSTPGGARCLDEGHTDWSGVDLLMTAFNVEVAVMDAAPEREKAAEFRDRWAGQVWLAFYPDTEYMGGREIVWNDEAFTVNVHRTALSDRVVTMLHERALVLPSDVSRECIRHLCAVYRVLETDTKGRQRAKWNHRGADHLFHAAVYARVALERVAEDLSWVDDGGGRGVSAADDDPVWATQGDQGWSSDEPGVWG